MARNGSGTFSFTATSVAPAVSGTLIESADFNTTMQEIADALTQSISKDGQTVITGDIDFDGNQLIIDTDGDTTITADTDDRIDFRIGGTDKLSFDSTGILDTNKNEIIQLSATASAVNDITVKNAATTVNPTIQSSGEANTGLILADSNSNEVAILESVASAVNEVTITNSATGNGPIIASTGGDTNVDININTKGSGVVKINGAELTTGKIIQIVEATPYTTYATSTTVIPLDDTIPQNTEGVEYITGSITPSSASNRLRITAIPGLIFGENVGAVMALFQDSTADALAAVIGPYLSGLTMSGMPVLTYEMAAGTTSSTTFKIRIGPNSAGNVYINGNNSTRRFGGVSALRLRIEEIAV